MKIAPIQVVGLKWIRGRASTKDGEVILDKDRAEEYEFLNAEASEKMAFELAVLPFHTKDEKEVKSFVGRYGLLSHGAEDIQRGENRESLDDWWREVMALSFVGSFYQTLQDSKASGSAKKIQGFLRTHRWGFEYLRPEAADFDEAYMVEASILLANLINAGLHGRREEHRCVWGLNATGPGTFMLMQHPPDLVSRAYAAFATLIANSVETRSCIVCGMLFRPKSKRGVACEAHQSTYRSRKSRGQI